MAMVVSLLTYGPWRTFHVLERPVSSSSISSKGVYRVRWRKDALVSGRGRIIVRTASCIQRSVHSFSSCEMVISEDATAVVHYKPLQ